ncbi:MAG: hypothetical protein ACM3QS_02655, partial [Bacteroidota bacterium]
DMWGKPAALQRFPLDRVRVGKSIEGALFDEFALDTGEGKPLRVRVEKSVHEETRRLLAILSGVAQPDIPAWQPAPAAPASPRFASSTLPEGRRAASHPMLTSGLLGGLGGAVGALASAIVLTLLGLIFGEPLFGTPDFGEGLGILLGLYCVVMFPIGGGILGAIPGILTGWLRVSHDEPITPLPLAIPGFLTVLTLSVAAAAALFFLVPQP